MLRWLFPALAAILVAALPAHGGIVRHGDPAIGVPASQPSAPAEAEARAPRDRGDPREARPGGPRQIPAPGHTRESEGVCATTSVCETY